ncbi:hypothetical protein [Candidatus Paracaedibacter symbiosus]|uniref:hypothetical protein n=1 Tax=Candidatus Paracaedibacter symbiosus TaxID=244582 RepID=UPI000509DBBC|nr:hypothetical protein [Candidatus Paracaedibacter symbiosus]
MDNLVLFFDINGTILALDTAQEKNIEVTLLQELAKRYTARWHESVPEPITYAKFVRRYLLQGDEKVDLILKRQRQQKYGDFLVYLHQNHPDIYQKVHTDFDQLRNTLLKSSGHLFPSFVKLLTELQIQQIPFTLVLRSFGEDIPAVQKELAIHRIMIKDLGHFRQGVLCLPGRQLSQPGEILQALIPGRHQAWQDDWSYWHAHQHEGEFGKPFYLSPHQPLSLFFDDKAIEKDIIHVQRLDGMKMSREEAVASGYLFAVDTLEAIRDDNYFCDRVFCVLGRRARELIDRHGKHK